MFMWMPVDKLSSQTPLQTKHAPHGIGLGRTDVSENIHMNTWTQGFRLGLFFCQWVWHLGHVDNHIFNMFSFLFLVNIVKYLSKILKSCHEASVPDRRINTTRDTMQRKCEELVIKGVQNSSLPWDLVLSHPCFNISRTTRADNCFIPL